MFFPTIIFLSFLAFLVRRAKRTRGIVGRMAAAIDREIQFDYLVWRIRNEEKSIRAFLDTCPSPGNFRFSIVVPLFGIQLLYVKELLSSVEKQTYANWELCFCVDGDPNREVYRYLAGLALAFPQKYKVVQHGENRGIAAASESALQIATGNMIVFVDGDDLLHKRALELLAASFSRGSDVDFVYTDHDFSSDLGFRFKPIRKPGWSPELLLNINYINHLTAVRRRCLAKVDNRFPDSAHGSQDWDLCLKLALHARRVAHVPIVLYHWRARPGSLADTPLAKPWAVAASHRVHKAHVEALHPLLTLANPQENPYAEPCFRTGTAKAQFPRLKVVQFGKARSARLDYAGDLEIVRIGSDRKGKNAGIVRALRQIEGNDEDVILFLDGSRPFPRGSLERQVAFAFLRGVGGVWPFKNDALRMAFTLGEEEGNLVQLAAHRSNFSQLTGNVLTGPLHCMMVEYEKLIRALSVEKEDPHPSFWEEEADHAAIGAVLGLQLLLRGFRNVSSKGLICDSTFGPVRIPRNLVPQTDPYI